MTSTTRNILIGLALGVATGLFLGEKAEPFQLIAEGYDSRAILVLWHAGSDEDCLRANLGTAASLTVEETKYGPRLRLWKPMPTLAAAPRITPIEQAATNPTLPPCRLSRR